MMIKGNDPENIRVGSTLATDEFAGTKFDFMLSNPPYGKSWASELKNIKDGKEVIDPRFVVRLQDYWGEEGEVDATPRSSDGQLLFLMEMVSKMKPLSQSPLGTRIASVHNGSSLFTGDAGGGESNIRRFIIENDLLEAIIQLPNNLFLNTVFTTCCWLMSYYKEKKRKGKVQLIDAGLLFRKLRKNLGNKNCEFAPEHIREIVTVYEEMKEVKREIQPAHALMQQVGNAVYDDFNLFSEIVDASLKGMKAKLTAAEKNALLNAVSWYDEKAEKVVKAELKFSGNKLEELLDFLGCTVDNLPDYGYYPTEKAGIYLTYESESELRDTENIPLKENIHDYFLREVKPHVSEAWINMDATRIGYEISFNKYFYRHKPLRSLEEVTADILALEAESDGLIKEILGDG